MKICLRDGLEDLFEGRGLKICLGDGLDDLFGGRTFKRTCSDVQQRLWPGANAVGSRLVGYGSFSSPLG